MRTPLGLDPASDGPAEINTRNDYRHAAHYMDTHDHCWLTMQHIINSIQQQKCDNAMQLKKTS
jgi:hypothetical protein